jgi:dTDP-4-dehydrorhamnose 3,5-epimerase
LIVKIVNTTLPGVLIIEPQVFEDERGFFFESYNARRFEQLTGMRANFVQDNHSRSAKNVLRGLHYQIQQPQGKLMRVIEGEVLDVAVDIRRSSPTFGRWTSVVLSRANRRQVWIPEGYAHGFAVLSEFAEFIYKVTDYWAVEHERCIRWDDPQLAIDWQLQGPPRLSAKDRQGVALAQADVFP